LKKYLFIFLAVFLVWIAYQVWLPHIPGFIEQKDKFAIAGTFGDSYGALNTLFSGLAFAGIIVSIFLQSQELKDTRAELKGQKEQLELQAFENAFFHLLKLQNQIVESKKYKSQFYPNFDESGQLSLKRIKDDFEQKFIRDNIVNLDSNIEKYENFYNNYAHWYLGHYFRNLYQVLKYVHYSNVFNKKFYTNIVRAQLSSDALFLLFYNSLSKYGKDKFYPLIVEYQLLEHLPIEGIVNDARKYNSRAFGDNQEWKGSLLHYSDNV
jgi:hypothetical protein